MSYILVTYGYNQFSLFNIKTSTPTLIDKIKEVSYQSIVQKLQARDKSLQKEYILITTGRPPAYAGDIRTQIIRDPKNRHRFKAVIDTDEGKYARTIYHCIACYGNYSLIRVRIKTGRTHQIRVHMKYLGHPILGDPVYGEEKADRLYLHARELEITLPSGERRIFKAQVPREFNNVFR